MTVEIQGFAQPPFAAVKDAFADNFAQGSELGARFTLVRAGEVVVDLTGGFADRAKTQAFGPQTLAPIFSTTKALAAVMIARLVEAGRLDYGQTVASLWPEFAQAGKGAITVEQALSHQAGLSGLVEPMDPKLWLDAEAIAVKIAAAAPLWPPGTASGYHPATFGPIAAEIFRRAEGRTIGRALREDLAEPLGLDLWIGLPDAEHHRVAEVRRPNGPADFGPLNPATRAAFLTRWAQAGGVSEAEARRAELPAANGHATALALARLAGALANDGWLDGETVLAPALIAEMARARICGPDMILPFDLCWGAGVLRNDPVMIWGPGRATFGHAGWGGSCLFVDPERKLGGAYVMNRQSTALIGDPRARRLIEAAYAALA